MLPLLVVALAAATAAAPDGSRTPASPAGGYGAPALAPSYCQPRTSFVTVTSTKLKYDTVFNTHTKLVPTTVYQELTETRYQPSTQVHTQQVTSYGKPAVRVSTKVLYDTMYDTKHTYQTETQYATRTKTVYYTETEVVSKYYTKTNRVPNYVTRTAYRTEAYPELRYVTKTEVQYRQVTETQNVPLYVTRTETKGYPEYKYVTETAVDNQYITVTKTQYQNQYVTVCPRPAYPSYGK